MQHFFSKKQRMSHCVVKMRHRHVRYGLNGKNQIANDGENAATTLPSLTAAQVKSQAF
jgi:hypothetical protein